MNYFGGKSRVAKWIVPIIQKAIDENDIHFYLEGMCGGLNIIDKVKCDRKFAYDLNKYLIYLFIHLKDGGELPETVTKETYDRARTAWYKGNTDKEFQDWEIGCYGALCSYGGRFYDGGWSYEVDEKLKEGTIKHRNYYQERKRNLLKQFEQPLCQDIMFGISDYRDLNEMSGYCIYMDPPYAKQKEYANSKDRFNHNQFWDVMRKWSQNNIVFVSELSAPDDFDIIWEQEINRSIKSSGSSRAVEKLFRYKG